MIYHVLPINDIEEHSEEVEMALGFIPVSKCKCMAQPQLDPDSGGWVIVHNSFDGREALEEANEILNQNKPS